MTGMTFAPFAMKAFAPAVVKPPFPESSTITDVTPIQVHRLEEAGGLIVIPEATWTCPACGILNEDWYEVCSACHQGVRPDRNENLVPKV